MTETFEVPSTSEIWISFEYGDSSCQYVFYLNNSLHIAPHQMVSLVARKIRKDRVFQSKLKSPNIRTEELESVLRKLTSRINSYSLILNRPRIRFGSFLWQDEKSHLTSWNFPHLLSGVWESFKWNFSSIELVGQNWRHFKNTAQYKGEIWEKQIFCV